MAVEPRKQHEAMRAIAALHTDLDEATKAWLKSLTKAEKDTFIYPYARIQMRNLMRSDVRQIEHDVQIWDTDDRQKLLDKGLFHPDGRWVFWGDMTPDDHRLRAAWLRGTAGGYLRTADEHDQAAAIIEAAGVSCLREVPQ